MLDRADVDLFEHAFNEAPIGMAIVELDGRWRRANASLCNLLGYSEEELRARSFQSMTHPRDLDRNLSSVPALLSGNISRYQDEKRYFHKSGLVIPVRLTVSLVRTRTGVPDFFITQIQDLSLQRQVEKERRLFFTVARDLFAVVSEHGRLIEVNSAWTKLLGHEPADLLDWKYSQFIHVADRTDISNLFSTLSAADGVFRNRWQAVDGKYHSVEWTKGGVAGGCHYLVGRHVQQTCEGCSITPPPRTL